MKKVFCIILLFALFAFPVFTSDELPKAYRDMLKPRNEISPDAIAALQAYLLEVSGRIYPPYEEKAKIIEKQEKDFDILRDSIAEKDKELATILEEQENLKKRGVSPDRQREIRNKVFLHLIKDTVGESLFLAMKSMEFELRAENLLLQKELLFGNTRDSDDFRKFVFGDIEINGFAPLIIYTTTHQKIPEFDDPDLYRIWSLVAFHAILKDEKYAGLTKEEFDISAMGERSYANLLLENKETYLTSKIAQFEYHSRNPNVTREDYMAALEKWKNTILEKSKTSKESVRLIEIGAEKDKRLAEFIKTSDLPEVAEYRRFERKQSSKP